MPLAFSSEAFFHTRLGWKRGQIQISPRRFTQRPISTAPRPRNSSSKRGPIHSPCSDEPPRPFCHGSGNTWFIPRRTAPKRFCCQLAEIIASTRGGLRANQYVRAPVFQDHAFWPPHQARHSSSWKTARHRQALHRLSRKHCVRHFQSSMSLGRFGFCAAGQTEPSRAFSGGRRSPLIHFPPSGLPSNGETSWMLETLQAGKPDYLESWISQPRFPPGPSPIASANWSFRRRFPFMKPSGWIAIHA